MRRHRQGDTRRPACWWADNVFLNGYVLDPELSAEGIERTSAVALRAFNAMVAADDQMEAVMLPIADGLTIAYKR